MPNKPFVTIKARVPEAHAVIESLGTGPTGDVQRYFTKRVGEHLKRFMPRESGKLVGSISYPTDTRVRVSTEYARFLFFGVTAKGEPVRYDNSNPQGGAHWDRRMVAADGKQIARELRLYAIGRRRK